MTKLLLDSGDPQEYKIVANLTANHNSQLWGSTTNPSLIAKTLSGQKVSMKEAFSTLQKNIIDEIVQIVPGAVSAEVYASTTTTAAEMVEQGREIASWHPRVVVKLPTTLEGFKARTILRSEGITINNTLVFSQEQVYAISLHEQFMTKEFGETKSGWPCFISPFIGRLDDKGQSGVSFLTHGIDIVKEYFPENLVWMLAASIRNTNHLKATFDLACDMATLPLKVYTQWFNLSPQEQNAIETTFAELEEIPRWNPSKTIRKISSTDQLIEAMQQETLSIHHPLTDAGIEKFVADWQNILL
ncbi:MAG TPA: transaldolase family protein [Patescibacteria group bacterium]|nr:transaldolase family protein [Patescibacteria group bacterium]